MHISVGGGRVCVAGIPSGESAGAFEVRDELGKAVSPLSDGNEGIGGGGGRVSEFCLDGTEESGAWGCVVKEAAKFG